MVVSDFDFVDISFFPAKTDTPLAIDSHAKLSLAITCECLETVGWGNPKIIKVTCLTEHSKLVQGALLNVPWKAPRSLLIPYLLGFIVSKALYHRAKLESFPSHVNTYFRPT